jgi:large subunit ribosomal protein L24e
MAKCSFCAEKIEDGTGKAVVLKTGKMFWFCSSKCERSHKMGRDPRKVKWVKG